jgi:hypothetical protein
MAGTAIATGNYGVGSEREGIFRFINLVIPAGATITAATLDLISNAAGQTGCNLIISAVDEDSSAAPTTYNEWNTDHGLHTTATVPWAPVGAAGGGETKTTPDISTVVQEIVSRPGWVSGANAVHIHIDDAGDGTNKTQAWASYDHATYGEPTLTVTYSVASGGTGPVLRAGPSVFGLGLGLGLGGPFG